MSGWLAPTLTDASKAYLNSLGVMVGHETSQESWSAVVPVLNAALLNHDESLSADAAQTLMDLLDGGDQMEWLKSFWSAAYIQKYRQFDAGITATLAPLLLDSRVYGGNVDLRNKYLVSMLIRDDGPHAIPPEVIKALGATGPTDMAGTYNTLNSDSFSPSATDTMKEAAARACENWFTYAMANHASTGPIDPKLIRAYIALDPAAAKTWVSTHLPALDDMTTSQPPIDMGLIDAYVDLNPVDAKVWIEEKLLRTMAADGTCNQALMEHYRDLNASSDLPTSNAPPSSPPYWPRYEELDPDFGTPPPGGVCGWAYLALTSLTRGITGGRQLDSTMLNRLDDANSFAATYVRWKALVAQAPTGTLDAGLLTALADSRPLLAADLCEAALTEQLNAGQNLNADYLKILAHSDQTAATQLIDRAFRDALQPQNYLEPDSDTGASKFDGLTSDATPTVHVSLNGMGTTMPKIGDVINLYDVCNGVTHVTTHAITAIELALGYAAITASNMADGTHTIVTTFTAAGSTVESPPSTPPLTVQIATVRPTITGPVVGKIVGPPEFPAYAYSITLKINSGSLGLANVAPSRTDFRVKFNGDDFYPDSVEFDAVNKTVRLVFSPTTPPLTSGSFFCDDGSALQDLAGNRLVVSNGMSVTGGTPYVVVNGQQNAEPPQERKPPRPLDQATWDVLNSIDSVAARRWWNDFGSAGLLGGPSMGSTDSTGKRRLTLADLQNLSSQQAIWAVFMDRADLAEEQLRRELQEMKQHSDLMGQLRDVVSAMNTMVEQMPKTAVSGDLVATALGTKFTDLKKKLDDTMNAVGLQLFPTSDTDPTPGLINSTFTNLGVLKGFLGDVQGKVDSEGTLLHTKSLNIQKYTTLQTQSYEAVSASEKKFADLNSSILRNF